MWFYVGVKQAGVANPYVALVGAGIGLLGALVVFFLKEWMDKKKARRTTVNILKMMCVSLKGSLSVAPEQTSILTGEKAISLLHEVAKSNELIAVYQSYEECVRRYRQGWSRGGIISDADQTAISTLLDGLVVQLDGH